MSYHIAKIPRGEFGEISKIEEELCELVDSIDQGNKIMALCELADLGFPILAEDMCWRNRASVGDLTRELRGSFAHTDCPSCTREWMCPECEGVERKALRAARRAYALTA